MSDTVKVVVAFAPLNAPKGRQAGDTVEVSTVEARRMVREGRARYATEAQERKAEPQAASGK